MLRNNKLISEDPELYRQAVSGFPDFVGSIFYDYDFLVLSAAILGLKVHPIVILDGSEPLGIANLVVKARPAIKSCTIPHHFQYYGPLIHGKPRECWEAIDSYLSDHFDLAVFSLVPETEGDFIDDRWLRRKRVTFRLEPAAFETLRDRCTDDVKNKLNKAARSGIEIEQVKEFPRAIYRATFARHKLKPPVDDSILHRWIENLDDRGLIKIFVAKVQGVPVAFRAQLRYGRFAYDWLAGSLPEYHPLGVNQFLMLHIGRDHFDRGVQLWDLCGGDVPAVADFKRSFGPTQVSHYEIERRFSFRGNLYRSLMKFRGRRNV